jgi:hypothetical protein
LPFCYRLNPAVYRVISRSSQSDRAGRSTTEGAEMNILRNTRRILTVALVVTALSAPVAAARPFEELHPSTADTPASGGVPTDRYPDLIDRQAAVGLGTGPTVEPPEASSVQPSGGFDWGDASIGAAAVLAIMAIATGVVLEVSRRRRPRPKVA